MLGEMIKFKVKPEQLNTFAPFLSRRGAGELDAALFASLIAEEDQGVPVFAQPAWRPILEQQLRSEAPQRLTLAEHLLESAHRENWQVDPTSIIPQFSDEERADIGRAALRAEECVLAMRYLSEQPGNK
jgi:hypothetical protein